MEPTPPIIIQPKFTNSGPKQKEDAIQRAESPDIGHTSPFPIKPRLTRSFQDLKRELHLAASSPPKIPIKLIPRSLTLEDVASKQFPNEKKKFEKENSLHSSVVFKHGAKWFPDDLESVRETTIR